MLHPSKIALVRSLCAMWQNPHVGQLIATKAVLRLQVLLCSWSQGFPLAASTWECGRQWLVRVVFSWDVLKNQVKPGDAECVSSGPKQDLILSATGTAATRISFAKAMIKDSIIEDHTGIPVYLALIDNKWFGELLKPFGKELDPLIPDVWLYICQASMKSEQVWTGERTTRTQNESYSRHSSIQTNCKETWFARLQGQSECMVYLPIVRNQPSQKIPKGVGEHPNNHWFGQRDNVHCNYWAYTHSIPQPPMVDGLALSLMVVHYSAGSNNEYAVTVRRIKHQSSKHQPLVVPPIVKHE